MSDRKSTVNTSSPEKSPHNPYSPHASIGTVRSESDVRGSRHNNSADYVYEKQWWQELEELRWEFSHNPLAKEEVLAYFQSPEWREFKERIGLGTLQSV